MAAKEEATRRIIPDLICLLQTSFQFPFSGKKAQADLE
ncbi:unnamed protein product [Oikopleura dioica]|uniref:Uncharacterized protein n=1 Tax=Oikopleura dioica TaxID=34765 RepID=E4YIA3_OIKDI|nr:unnamed protein product [Oikopleura dioica]